MLKLVKPTKEYEQEAKEYIAEFYQFNSKIHGVGSLDKYLKNSNYDELLNYIKQMEIKEMPNLVRASTYFLVDEKNNQILGMSNIRHSLNDFLYMFGGHIGYSIRPLERRKGYAKILLYLSLEVANSLGIEKVLITSDDDNFGSFKTIEALGGVLENKIEEDDGTLVRRYFLDVHDSLEKNKEKYNVMIRR